MNREAMHTTIATARPKGLLIVAVLALLWNLAGAVMFWMQWTMTVEAVAALPAPQRAVYEATPAWLDAVFAVAVLAGLLGAVGLLLKKRWAVPMFLLSLVAVVVQVAAAYAVTPAWSAYGPAGLAMPVVLIVIAALLWQYARKAAARGWLA